MICGSYKISTTSQVKEQLYCISIFNNVSLKELFKIIEPEEANHARLLEKIATKYGMKEVKDCHDKGLEELGLKIKNK